MDSWVRSYLRFLMLTATRPEEIVAEYAEIVSPGLQLLLVVFTLGAAILNLLSAILKVTDESGI